MNLGRPITELETIKKVTAGCLYVVEPADGTGTKNITHEMLVEEVGNDLNIGNMKQLETKEKGTIVGSLNEVNKKAGTVFGGTDGLKAGTPGIVPAPEPEDKGKVLGANGEWIEGAATSADNVKFNDGQTAEEIIESIISRLEPVGKIIAYMGTSAPKNYLACDGTVYKIDEYKTLAEHIKTQFGRYDYWGGDGTKTFKVLDLHGEFLRGAGTNSHSGQGSGAAVGEHQDATNIKAGAWAVGTASIDPNIYQHGANGIVSSKNFDKQTTTVYRTGYTAQGRTTASSAADGVDYYTTRPTNTAVLYCIKYQ